MSYKNSPFNLLLLFPAALFITFLACEDSKLVSISVTPATGEVVFNQNIYFEASGKYDDGTTEDITSSATWNSSNEKIVTIGSEGLVITRGIGSTYISASSGKITSPTAQITVTMPEGAAGISIETEKTEIVIGEEAQISAILSFEDSSTMDVGKSIYWNSSNTASLEAGDGVMYGVTMGTSVLSVALGEFTDTITITVKPIYAAVSIENLYGQEISFEVWKGEGLYYQNGVIVGESVQERIAANKISGAPPGESALFTVQVENLSDSIFIVIGIIHEGTGYYLSDYTLDTFNSTDTSYLQLTEEGFIKEIFPTVK